MSAERPRKEQKKYDLSELNKLEKDIIDLINKMGKSRDRDEKSYLKHFLREDINALIDYPFCTTSEEFQNNSVVKKYFGDSLWMLIENYLRGKESDLTLIQNKIDNSLAEAKGSEKSGTKVLPSEIVHPHLIRNIYLSNNTDLINLFSKKLPVPKSNLFSGHELPESIAKNEEKSTPIIKALLDKGLEPLVTKMQRKFRNNQLGAACKGRIF